MAAVEFRDLAGSALEPALGALLEDLLAEGRRVVVRLVSEERLRALDAGLWTYHPASFLPHGSPATGRAGEQPIWLTIQAENPNGATVLLLLEDAEAHDLESFERCLYLFDRSDADARRMARDRWRLWRDASIMPIYLEHARGSWRAKD